MASGHARRRGGRVHVLDRNGKPRWHEMWLDLPYIAKPNERADGSIRNGPGCRPYIDYANTTKARWSYTDWRCEPGEIAGCTPDERGRGYVLIEPNIKQGASPNKHWPGWRELSRAKVKWAQMCAPGVSALPGVHRIETHDFRQACNVMLAADALILPEGGLHHAAAALGMKAIVLFGGMTSPLNTGYDTHRNLWIDDPDALGWRIPHQACRDAWKRITPDLVLSELDTLNAA